MVGVGVSNRTRAGVVVVAVVVVGAGRRRGEEQWQGMNRGMSRDRVSPNVLLIRLQ